ncbi:primosomal protein N', partial [Listeria booriae]|uniref:replication restart helicase PriA n=1 Tax=Listeria booriae TaxID=1552123 RepID=UPI00164DA350
MQKIAQVIVDVPAMQVDRPFDYLIPEAWRDIVCPGMRVSVPFGNRALQGFVVGTSDSSEFSKLKEIREMMDLAPVINEELLSLGDWIAEETLAYRITAYQAMLPAALRAKYEKYFVLLDTANDEAERLFEGYETMDWKKAEQLGALPTLQKWLKNGTVDLVYQVKTKVTKKTMRAVRSLCSVQQLEDAIAGLSKSAKAQIKILQFFQVFDGDYITVKELRERVQTTDATIQKVASLGLIEIFDQHVSRDPYENHDFEASKPLPLLPDQQAARDAIVNSAQTGNQETFLLYGVTGSGKTEIYLQSIEAVLAEGKEAIVLVPEIALTPQMVERFKSRFGKQVAVLHSALSAGEKYDEWRKIEQGKAKVVVGARSAVFAPFMNLGIIIIDEEHEASYKQEDNPRYHARDVAIERAKRHGCPVVLGSATPSLESFARAGKKRYTLLELPTRVNDSALPEVTVVDMSEELRNENRTEFSAVLLEKI